MPAGQGIWIYPLGLSENGLPVDCDHLDMAGYRAIKALVWCKDNCQNVVGDGRNRHKICFQELWHSGKNVSVAVSSGQSQPKQKQWVFFLLRLLFLIIPKLLRIKQYPLFRALERREHCHSSKLSLHLQVIKFVCPWNLYMRFSYAYPVSSWYKTLLKFRSTRLTVFLSILFPWVLINKSHNLFALLDLFLTCSECEHFHV